MAWHAGCVVALALARVRATFGDAHTLGDISTLSCAGATCAIDAFVDGGATQVVPLRLVFFGPSTVQWWMAIDSNFSDIGAAASVIVAKAQPVVVVSRDAGAYYEISQTPPPSPNVLVRLQKSPLLLSIVVDGDLVVEEASPLSWNTTTSWQTLKRDAAPFAAGLTAEWFFGGGMQNGRFSHRDERIRIAVGYDCAPRPRSRLRLCLRPYARPRPIARPAHEHEHTLLPPI